MTSGGLSDPGARVVFRYVVMLNVNMREVANKCQGWEWSQEMFSSVCECEWNRAATQRDAGLFQYDRRRERFGQTRQLGSR